MAPGRRDRPQLKKPPFMPESIPHVNSVTACVAVLPSNAAPPEGWRACPDIPGALVRVSQADVLAEAVEAVEADGAVEAVEMALAEARVQHDALATQLAEAATVEAVESSAALEPMAEVSETE
eukprot:scaffold109199_cov57-Phaeocystis_antarctica.AAC.1